MGILRKTLKTEQTYKVFAWVIHSVNVSKVKMCNISDCSGRKSSFLPVFEFSGSKSEKMCRYAKYLFNFVFNEFRFSSLLK